MTSFTPQNPQNQQWAQQTGAPLTPAPGTALGTDLSESFKWSFSALGRHWKALFIPSIIWGVVTLIFSFISIGSLSAAFAQIETTSDAAGNIVQTGGVNPVGLLSAGFFAFLIFLVVAAWSSGIAGAAAKIAAGQAPTIKDGLFNAKAFIVMFVVGLIAAISGITVVGPLVVAFFFCYATYAVVADNLGVIDALKASAKAALAKPIHTIVLGLIYIVAVNILSFTVIGTFLAVPFFALVYTAIYVRITGRQPALPVAA